MEITPQVVVCGDLEEFGGKNATQIMIFLPPYMRAENSKWISVRLPL